MLRIKNIYALLLIGMSLSGCLTDKDNSNKMHKQELKRTSSSGVTHSTEESGPGTSSTKKARLNLDDEKLKILNKSVQNLLHSKKLVQGQNLDYEKIESIISQLNKNISIEDIDPYYIHFLTTYGSVYGAGYNIYGPTKSVKKDEDKMAFILKLQDGFQNECIDNKIMSKEDVKCCWLISSDENKRYYINLYSKNKGIYYINNSNYKSDFFAEDFVEFLDKLFTKFNKKYKAGHYNE